MFWKAALGVLLVIHTSPLLGQGFGLCTGSEPRPCSKAEFLFQHQSPVEFRLGERVMSPEAHEKSESRLSVKTKTALVSAGFLISIPLLGRLLWWGSEPRVPFNRADEGWFGQDTYSGGADKTSHFVLSYLAYKGLSAAYRAVGNREDSARWLALAGVSIGGLVIEMGDGFTRFGFSWEDVAMNVLGASAGAAISAARLDDTLGFRYGQVPKSIPPPCCRASGYGGDYSREITTFDLKLLGFLPRVGIKPGLGRFFLLSLTYGSKGYRYSPVEVRERNIGIEVGLSLPELLRAAGVKDNSWWGKPILVFFTYFRIPFTAFGWRYDLNSGRWHGPDSGEKFDPGRVIYD